MKALVAVAVVIGLVFTIVIAGVTGLLFRVWPTSVPDSELHITPNVIDNLRLLRAERKFEPDPKRFYPGATNEVTRQSAETGVNLVVDQLIVGLPTKAKEVVRPGGIQALVVGVRASGFGRNGPNAVLFQRGNAHRWRRQFKRTAERVAIWIPIWLDTQRRLTRRSTRAPAGGRRLASSLGVRLHTTLLEPNLRILAAASDMTYSSTDLMKIAIEEHLKCSEYPRVGAVVAKDGKILSTGHRGEISRRHAERVAIEKLTREELIDSTIYTTLEPCVDLRDDQPIDSCVELIVSSGIKEVFIGVLDPNGTIYSHGFRRLLENNLSVKFFNRKLRAAIEEETFEFGEVHTVYGSGKRRVPVVHSGIEITVLFSETDARAIPIKWASLQPEHGCVDLSSLNGAVKVAAGARSFADITDPTVFRFPSHFARMRKGMIAVVRPARAGFCVLVQLVELYQNDVLFQWEVRNDAQ